MSRLDQTLVERGLCQSREQAKRSVLAGRVRVNGQLASKPSDTTKPGDDISLLEPEKYVSRGGLKLEHALEHFGVDVTDLVAIDLGASTGGFTDCLLQRGARKVYAVDVGRGQLAWKLRQDKRVVVMERTNARFLTPASFLPGAGTAHPRRLLTPGSFPAPFSPVDLVVADCSFISLRKILPPAVALLGPSGKILALIKPQFEAGKAEADKGAGVIRDPKVHSRVLSELQAFVSAQLRLQWRGITESPLLGPAGNKEFLVLIEKNG
jgi:23S rRNA (cytidine1920-2'-O)/16S rRNA (cytidine1409-2'-O)-methyltransferase